MSDTTHDDLVKRARDAAEHLEEWVQKYTGFNKKSVEADILRNQADRIEELEAKLAKAEDIIHIVASDKWDERMGEAVDLSCEYLAELKGQDDE